jgi:DNA polymerase epsilon subunit 1
MAGIVTKTGADLITQARKLVEQIGRPLELDTDGIWCILPHSFPDVYNFKTVDGGKLRLEYPCVMLNADVHDHFTNHQYQSLKDPEKGIYETRSECSIFFEVDGPYRCMVLPSSTEEGKLLKKRYAVFNFDGSLAELKGFELKRRGELGMVKTFQSQVFERFLDGTSLKECYDSVAEVANHWIDVLDTQGESLETDELVDLISENRSMSRQLEDYGDQKGTSQTTAKRLGEFLGAEIIKDKGLNCKFIIAEQPYGAPVTERAIPVAIWKAEPAVLKHHLRKWLKAPGLDGEALDIRNVLDWEYYTNRLGKTIQKIITIPAALQKIPNPVPRVPHPDWLNSKVRKLNDRFQQQSIRSMFQPKSGTARPALAIEASSSPVDIEDFGGSGDVPKRPIVHKKARRINRQAQGEVEQATATPDVAESRVQLTKEDFSDWLKQKKALWRGARGETKKRGAGEQGLGRNSTSSQVTKKPRVPFSSMEGYIRDAAMTLSQSEWHVIEVREMTSYDSNGPGASSSGDFVLWVLTGNESLQKVHVSVPRTVYVTSRGEITCTAADILMKKMDKHLPHNKTASFTYEVTMPEHVYKTKEWTRYLLPVDSEKAEEVREDLLETIYETETPLMSRALTELGAVVKASQHDTDAGKNRKSYALSDLQRVVTPSEGEYLHHSLKYKRIFLYTSINARTKTGVVAVFLMSNGRGGSEPEEHEAEDITRPSTLAPRTLRLNASCHLWVVKPGSRKGQKNLSIKQCEGLFSQLLETIQGLAAEADDHQSDYSAVSPESKCQMAGLKFVDSDNMAFTSANEIISSYAKSNNGPTFLLLNSNKPVQQLRRAVPSCNSFPVVMLPFPPGPAHNPSMRTLPSLNWEPAAVQLCMESYVFMGAVSYPKRVSYARYGQVPIGNLGNDEALALYDVSFGRQLVKSRALSWASELPGFPDVGVNFLPSATGGDVPLEGQNGILVNQNELWGDDDELASPVIRRPGAYRCVCAEIDVHDLAIAALTDPSFSQSTFATNQGDDGRNPPSPNNVAMFEAAAQGILSSKNTGPLGDEMSTAVSLPLLRAMIFGWLRDAFASNNEVADDMLHHVYRLVSSPDPLLNDPALHRVVHSMMKETFLRLLGELQRLGCVIVCASFHKVTIATNKTMLGEGEEYVNFVISTIRNRCVAESGSHLTGGLGRVALRPSMFYTQFLFLDEYNFGGIQLARRDVSEGEISEDLLLEEDGVTILPSVVSGWNMKNYLDSEIAQEYFRAIVGRFSKDVLRKQLKLRTEGSSVFDDSSEDQLLIYKRKLISKHFSSYLTRAVGEISKDAEKEGLHSVHQPLEFIKSVMTVLELDTDVQKEVHLLKRSLLAQIGVPEYASVVKWENPCVNFILPDVFCGECHESRDVNLCDLPHADDEEGVNLKQWMCQDCGTLYPNDDIERRLIDICDRKMIRYQLQDLRCVKTNRVATRALSKQSDCSANLKLGISRDQALSQIRILHDIATQHELECLQETTGSLLGKME